jgi:hypothetical protein
MAVRKGRSELLVNFACGAKSWNLDLPLFRPRGRDRRGHCPRGPHRGAVPTVFDERGAEPTGRRPPTQPGTTRTTCFGQIVVAMICCVNLMLVWLGHDVLLEDVNVVGHPEPARVRVLRPPGQTSSRTALCSNTGFSASRGPWTSRATWRGWGTCCESSGATGADHRPLERATSTGASEGCASRSLAKRRRTGGSSLLAAISTCWTTA